MHGHHSTLYTSKHCDNHVVWGSIIYKSMDYHVKNIACDIARWLRLGHAQTKAGLGKAGKIIQANVYKLFL